ncbi:MAG: hypothetical protein ACI4XM_07125 [Candidatus Coprovivens sp.]
MESNVNFRKDLIVSYLSQLVRLGNREEFDKYYQSVESYLQEVVNNSKDLGLLKKVRDIITFKTKSIDMNL